ncbi:MAG: ribonuclease J [Fusobacteria bacterium]|nr:ribonuclease J [Fusobacteriota bacterium]
MSFKVFGRKKEEGKEVEQNETRSGGENKQNSHINKLPQKNNNQKNTNQNRAQYNPNNRPNIAPRREENKKIVEKERESEENLAQVNDKKLDKLFIMPLGGLQEVGKNNMLYQYRDEIIMVDVGVTFPSEEMLGIDLVIADYTYITNNKEKLKGIVLTHGHEDHIGALPYLYQQTDFRCPVLGTKLTVELAKEKFKSNGHKNIPTTFVEMQGRSKYKIGKYFEVEYIRVTHSIPDACSIAITTPIGTVIHTGDFKIDLTPMHNEVMDLYKFAEYGEKGVLALLADSTNAERDGWTNSELAVGESLRAGIEKAKGRVIVGTFATNVHRIQQVFHIAKTLGRKIALDGRSMHKVTEVARRTGHLEFEDTDLIDLRNMHNYPENEILILCTGTQGEPLAALTRVAHKMHKFVFLSDRDTIILSATPIPGNEKAVYKTINSLLKSGANVIYEKVAGMHASGHASREELVLMMRLTRPKFFIPVHGEYKMLTKHKEIAKDVGIPESNILIPENGMKIELTRESIKDCGKIPAGAIFIDGLGVGDVGDSIIKDRQNLSENGIVIVVIQYDKDKKRFNLKPEVTTKGFMYNKYSDELMEQIEEKMNLELLKFNQDGEFDELIVKSRIRDILNKVIYLKMKRNPVVIPIIVEV